jgi:hypothetical protein
MDRPRKVELFTPQLTPNGGVDLINAVNITADYLASVCSRNAFHPVLNLIAGGNSSGRVHIIR